MFRFVSSLFVSSLNRGRKLEAKLAKQSIRKYIIASLLISLVGVISLVRSRAATQTVSLEPENAVLAGSAHNMSDPNASGGKYIHFGGDHQASCTIGQLGSMGPCIDNNLIPAARSGVSTTKLSNTGLHTTPNGIEGAFRSRCDFSHMSYEDPILYPNQPRKAHLHTFFGNTGTDYSTDTNKLTTTGNSTCSGGILNRSAYWIPSMIDMSIGRPIIPNDDRSEYNSDLEVYYKTGFQGVGYEDIRAFPVGFEMIAGNPAANTTKPADTSVSRVRYFCEGPGAGDREPINPNGGDPMVAVGMPVCSVGNRNDPNDDPVMVMVVTFPQCNNGQIRSANGRSHLAYGRFFGGPLPRHTNTYAPTTTDQPGCPNTHASRFLPVMEMFVRWRITMDSTNEVGDTRHWRLSSDNYVGAPAGYSGHADYMFAWGNDPSRPGINAFQTIQENCWFKVIDCGYDLGNGKEPLWVRQWNSQ